MKAKNIRRAMLLSALSVLLCVSMLIGTTFAWFTDSVTSGSNIIKSGNLDIVLEYWNGNSWINAEGEVIPFVTADNRAQDQILWEPGCTYELAPFRVRNEGNLSAKFIILLNGVTGDEKLMEVIELKTRFNNFPESMLNGSAGNVYRRFEDAEYGIMYGMDVGNVVFDESVAAKGQVTPGTGHTDTSAEFTIIGHMAEEAGNEYQNLSIEGISITVIATQQTYESDSFNKYYDQDAQLPTVTYKYIDANTTEDTELGNGKVAVTVPAGASKGGYQVAVSNENTTTDANGQTTFSADIDLLKDGEKVQANGTTSYRVRIKVGTDLLIAKVLHKGEEITNYTYDPTAGIISFETASFSPFEVVYQQIPADATSKVVDANGKTEYFTTLNEAFEAISGKATITARNDMVLTETAVLDQNAEIVLDLNGKTLSGEVDALLKLTAGKVTIKNGTIKNVQTAATETKYGIYMAGNAVAEIKDVNIETIGTGIYMTDNARITELNANISSCVTTAGYNAFDAVCLEENAKIDLISGGNYTSYLADSIIEAKPNKQPYNHTESFPVRLNGAGAYIGEIRDGQFLGTAGMGNMGTALHVNNGIVDKISGGYFGFTEMSFQNPDRLIFVSTYNGASINTITGGTFVRGDYWGFGCDFETIVNNSGCQVVDTGTTVDVYVQFSTRVATYTLKVLEVKA